MSWTFLWVGLRCFRRLTFQKNKKYLFNQMMAFRAGKRPHKEMRFMARHMTVQEVAAIAAYYAALPPR